MAIFRTPPVRRRRKAHNLVIMAVLVTYVVWCEFASLHIKALFWKLPSRAVDSTTMLLVADPQLVGYRNEPHWLGWLTRADADRYIERAFAKALDTVRPDSVLFLGDLFDEGVPMSAQEFEWTMQRFQHTFPIGNRTNVVFISGDNDIGGEMEPVYSHLKLRFDARFPNRFVSDEKRREFEFSRMDMDAEPKIVKLTSGGDGMKILLSHVPVIRYLQTITWDLGEYRPDLILSAHDHTAEYYVRKERHSDQYSRYEATNGLRFSLTLGTNTPLVEIQVPTVSYRMGVPEMALGVLNVARITRGFTVEYESLWLPGRYPQLYGYGVLALIIFAFYFGDTLRPLLAWLRVDTLMRRLRSYRSNQKFVSI